MKSVVTSEYMHWYMNMIQYEAKRSDVQKVQLGRPTPQDEVYGNVK